MIAASTLLCLAVNTAQETRTFRDDKLGLAFQYPKDWKLRRERLYSILEIPLADGRTAKVQIINSNYKSKPESWQQVQKDVNVAANREVIKQWEEELLGVPLLLTRVNYSEGAQPEGLLIGLLFTKEDEKFLFRLTGPQDVFAQLESIWRESLLSLSTANGKTPQGSQNPAGGGGGSKPDKVIVMRQDGGKPAKPVLAPNVFPVNALSQIVNVRLMEEWTCKSAETGFVLTHPRLAGPVALTLLQSPEANLKSVLLAESSKSLGLFTKVERRSESKALYNRAGFLVSSIVRAGKTANGELVSHQAAGSSAGLTWVISYQSTNLAAYTKELPMLDQLMATLSVDYPS